MKKKFEINLNIKQFLSILYAIILIYTFVIILTQSKQKSVSAKIENVTYTPQKNHFNCDLNLSYTVQNKKYNSKIKTKTKTDKKYKVDDNITIYYAPTNPKIISPIYISPIRRAFTVLFIGIVLWCFVVLINYWIKKGDSDSMNSFWYTLALSQ